MGGARAASSIASRAGLRPRLLLAAGDARVIISTAEYAKGRAAPGRTAAADLATGGGSPTGVRSIAPAAPTDRRRRPGVLGLRRNDRAQAARSTEQREPFTVYGGDTS